MSFSWFEMSAVCCFAVLWLWILCADARGNVNRELKELHQELVGLESGGTSFPRKLVPYGSEGGKINRDDCTWIKLNIQMNGESKWIALANL